ncbi:YbaK/EbsC family protein [Salinifilum aidingensis]
MPTAAVAAERLGCAVGAIANSLVFAVDGDPVLVVASGGHRVDTGRLAGLLGVGKRKVKRADPEFVTGATGQPVGGVAPVGHPEPLRTVVDTGLEGHDVVWAGAGSRHAMFATDFAELLRVTAGTAADVGESAAV